MKFIDELGKLDLKGRCVAVFGTYLAGDFEGCQENGEENRRENSWVEMAEAIVFLVTNQFSFVTGTELMVDGGPSAKS